MTGADEPAESPTDAAAARARARGLPATAFWCAAVGLAGLGVGWRSSFDPAGRTVTTGFSAAGLAATVLGLVAVGFLALGWLRPRTPVWAGWAAAAAAVAAIVGLATGHSGGDASGAGPWLTTFGFAAAAVLAARAVHAASRAAHPPVPFR